MQSAGVFKILPFATLICKNGTGKKNPQTTSEDSLKGLGVPKQEKGLILLKELQSCRW
jgi:hypothetical protein